MATTFIARRCALKVTGMSNAIQHNTRRRVSTMVRVNNVPALTMIGVEGGKVLGRDSAEETLTLYQLIKERNLRAHVLVGLSDWAYTCWYSRAIRCKRKRQDAHPLDVVAKKWKVSPISILYPPSKYRAFVPILERGCMDGLEMYGVGRPTRKTWLHWFRVGFQHPMEALSLIWYHTAFWSYHNFLDEESQRIYVARKAPSLYKVWHETEADAIASNIYEYVHARFIGSEGHVIAVVKKELYPLVLEKYSLLSSMEEARKIKLETCGELRKWLNLSWWWTEFPVIFFGGSIFFIIPGLFWACTGREGFRGICDNIWAKELDLREEMK